MITAIRLSGARRRAARATALRRRERIEMHVVNATMPAPTIGMTDDGRGSGWLGPLVTLFALGAIAVAVLSRV